MVQSVDCKTIVKGFGIWLSSGAEAVLVQLNYGINGL